MEIEEADSCYEDAWLLVWSSRRRHGTGFQRLSLSFEPGRVVDLSLGVLESTSSEPHRLACVCRSGQGTHRRLRTRPSL